MVSNNVSITLMGIFALRVNGERQNLRLCGSTKHLFMLLACNGNHALRKDYIMDQVWPDTGLEKSRSNLNTALWRIKKYLNPYAGLRVHTYDDLIRFNIDETVQIDTTNLQMITESVVAALGEEGVILDALRPALIDAVTQCQGVFLEGCNAYWALPSRERYAALYIQALNLLMRDAGRCSDYETALKYGREILILDPLREGTQREVMWLYVLNGQRAQALIQYKQLSETLRTELSIDPMSETQALYDHIRTTACVPAADVPQTTRPVDFIPELATLEAARRKLLRTLTA